MSDLEGAGPPPPPQRLAPFLRAHRDEILAAWEREVRHSPQSKANSQNQLRDHLPEILDEIASATEQADTGADPRDRLLSSLSQLHALQRLEIGFDLSQVVREYSLLRHCVVEIMGNAIHRMPRHELQFLNAAIDYAISQAVTRYTQAQQQTLEALDRISMAGIESRDLGNLLERLLGAMVELVPAVDTAAILLREGDRLVSRAAVGIETREGGAPFSTPLDGGGFAAAVAAAGRPLLLRDAADSPLQADSMLRDRPVRVMFGVPLFDAGGLLGVAHIGSMRSDDISDRDKHLFEVLCHRAGAVIAQHALREQLRESEQRFRATFNQAAVGIAHVKPDGRWLRLNARFCDMLGYQESELRELSFRDITHPDDLATDNLQRQRLLDGEIAVYAPSKRYIRKDGSILWVHGTASVVRDEAGAPAYVIVVAEDISQLKLAEAERDRLLAAEQRARHLAEEAIRAREHMLAVVSHDLRNPMTAIGMSAGLLARRLQQLPDTNPLQQLVSPLQQAVERMEHLIGDLMDMARMQTGRFELSLAKVSANTLLEQALVLHRPLALDKGLALSAHPDPEDSQVLCDRDRVLQVLGNLLGNAIKFCEPGQEISLSAVASGDTLRFGVADSGPGIAPADLSHLFEPYWSAEHHARKGTGLGLFISKNIIDAHGGRIWVESEPGNGTRFFFTLKRA